MEAASLRGAKDSLGLWTPVSGPTEARPAAWKAIESFQFLGFLHLARGPVRALGLSETAKEGNGSPLKAMHRLQAVSLKPRPSLWWTLAYTAEITGYKTLEQISSPATEAQATKFLSIHKTPAWLVSYWGQKGTSRKSDESSYFLLQVPEVKCPRWLCLHFLGPISYLHVECSPGKKKKERKTVEKNHARSVSVWLWQAPHAHMFEHWVPRWLCVGDCGPPGPEFLENNLFSSALCTRPRWQAGGAAVERFLALDHGQSLYKLPLSTIKCLCLSVRVCF